MVRTEKASVRFLQINPPIMHCIGFKPINTKSYLASDQEINHSDGGSGLKKNILLMTRIAGYLTKIMKCFDQIRLYRSRTFCLGQALTIHIKTQMSLLLALVRSSIVTFMLNQMNILNFVSCIFSTINFRVDCLLFWKI